MIREIADKAEWNALYSQTESASGKFLQSWGWGEFQSSLGRTVHRFADGSVLAQVIELPLPLNGRYWSCPKGPTGPLPGLAAEAKKAGAVFLRIEPPFDLAQGDKNVMLSLSKHAVKSRDLNPRCTAIVDIAKSEEEILVALHPKTRYNIKVAAKHGVTVAGSTAPDPERFAGVMELFEQTAKRDGFRLHPRGHYEKQLSAPGVEVFAAAREGKLLAAAIVIFAGDTATYLHGASSDEDRNLMAPYALHWGIIKAAKERGCRRYDLWGISDDPRSGWAGITRFKRGWGGAETCAPGTFDLPISRFWYSVYRLARRLRS